MALKTEIPRIPLHRSRLPWFSEIRKKNGSRSMPEKSRERLTVRGW